MNAGPQHSVSVDGVTFDHAGRVLLIKRRDNGEWQAPGGVLELEEHIEDGVVREVLEETGVQVAVQRLTGVYKNLPRGVVALVYRCVHVAGSPRPSPEASEARWFEVGDIESLMSAAFHVQVEDALRPASVGPATRSHDGVTLLPPR